MNGCFDHWLLWEFDNEFLVFSESIYCEIILFLSKIREKIKL